MSMNAPVPQLPANTPAFLEQPLLRPEGLREYDGRWLFERDINLPGLTALGRAVGTQLIDSGHPPTMAVGNDYRSYALAVKNAFVLGLIQAGVQVQDIGVAISPMVYFAARHLGTGAGAMITASHNPNGWTGVKLGFDLPLTHGPEQMAQLRQIVLSGGWRDRPGGGLRQVAGVQAAYLDHIAGGWRLSRPLRVVCACGNGTAGAFAPQLLRSVGAEVVERHCTPDYTFPNYNPNPEDMRMLRDMGTAVRESGADLALGLDGDGDRVGVVDETGHEIFADVLGVMMARDLARRHPGARFLADVKSTGLFAADPVLASLGAQTEYWLTGHSHLKRRLAETGALAAFEKSGHFYFAPPEGDGFDCGLRAGLAVLRLMDARPGASLSALRAELPPAHATPTLQPACADALKYQVCDRLVTRLRALADSGGRLGGHEISDVLTINGARVQLAHGGWALVRASSNTPNLVVVCESPASRDDLRAIFDDFATILCTEPMLGPLPDWD